MNEVTLNKESALKSVLSNKEECIKAIRDLASAALVKGGKYSLYIDASSQLFVTEDVSNGKGKPKPNNDLCIYIADSKYANQISRVINDSNFWNAIYVAIVNNLKCSRDYKPYELFDSNVELGILADAELKRRESERNDLKVYAPDQIALKERIECIFNHAGMNNTAKDEYRKNAFSFDYITENKTVTFDGEDLLDFWALFLTQNTMFDIWGLNDNHGIEFNFGLKLGGESNEHH